MTEASRNKERAGKRAASSTAFRCSRALLVAGSACALTGPANALQLGEIEVHSALGQPLRASIAYALRPDEQLLGYCVSLASGASADGIPRISRARLTVENGRINIAGQTPITEPMVSVGLTVDCPYTANLTRSFVVMLDPYRPEPVAEAQPEPAVAAAAPAPRTSTAPVQARREPIGPTGTYRVQIGDSLSAIAARIQDRPIGLWQAVDVLFETNPHAFIDGDMNRLKAGSELTIPSFDGVSAPQVTERAPVETAEPATSSTAEEGLTAYDPAEAATFDEASGQDEDAQAPADALGVADEPAALTTDLAAEIDVTADQTGDLRPGDVRLSDDTAFVSPIESSDAVPADTAAPDAEPIAAPAPATTADEATGAWNSWWTAALAAGGAALALLGFALFRRRPGDPQPAAPAQEAQTIADDEPTAENRALSEEDTDVDFEVGENGGMQQAYALDADLSAGTGLQDGSHIEVAQDFGFSASAELGRNVDLELPADHASGETQSTDILPPQRVSEHTILEHEILPTDDDEYDLSMIVDATKQRFEDADVTAKDLTAVPVAPQSAEEESVGDYTLSNEIDYKILEQDYEDELTATQALNAEIAKAAIELADRLDESEAGSTESLEALASDDDITAENTVEMEPDLEEEEEEILSDDDDTGINEELTEEMPLSDETVEMNAAEDTEDAPDPGDTTATTELTAKLPSAENDPTVEMDIESGRVRTARSGR